MGRSKGYEFREKYGNNRISLSSVSSSLCSSGLRIISMLNLMLSTGHKCSIHLLITVVLYMLSLFGPNYDWICQLPGIPDRTVGSGSAQQFQPRAGSDFVNPFIQTAWTALMKSLFASICHISPLSKLAFSRRGLADISAMSVSSYSHQRKT